MKNDSQSISRHAEESPRGMEEVLAELRETKELLRASQRQCREVEQVLAESRERYEMSISGFNSGLWDWNLVTEELYFSPQTKMLLGYKDDEMPNEFRVFEALLHPLDHDRVMVLVEDYVVGRVQTYNVEHRLLHKDGHYRWILSRGAATRDKDGKALRIVGSSLDITERKRDEQALRESQEKFQAIFDGSNDGLMLVTETGVFECNLSAVKMFGFSKKDELLGLHPVDFSPPLQSDGRTSLQVSTEYIQCALREGCLRFEWQHRRRNGEVFLAEVLLSAFDLCGERVLQSAVRDISERKRVDEALRESERRFANAFRHAAIGVALVGVDGRWLKVNSALSDLVGYSQEEMLQTTVQDITHPEDVQAGLVLVERIQTGKIRTYQLEKRYIHKQGHSIWVSVSVSGIQDSNGGLRYFIAQIQDITKRKHAEQKLRLTQFSIDHASDAIFWINSDAKIVNGNEAACRNFGCTEEELLSSSIFDWDVQMTEGKWKRFWRELVEKRTLIFESVQRTRDGRHFPVEINVNYFEFEGYAYHISYVRDISERKQAEKVLLDSKAELKRRVEERTQELDKANESLRLSERFAYATLDALSAHICVLDEAGSIVTVNKSWRAFADANGLESNNAGQGYNYLEVCDKVTGKGSEWAQAFAEGIRAVICGDKKDFSLEYPCHSQTEKHWFFARVTRFSGVGPFRTVVAHEDVTQRRLAEQELRENRAKLTQILDQMPLGVAWANVETRNVEFANRKCFDLFGCTLSDIDTLEKWFTLVYPDPLYRQEVANWWETKMANGDSESESRPVEYNMTRKDGVVRHVEINGRIVAGTMLAVFNDVTERKQSEELIRKFARATEQSPVSVVITDKNGTIDYVNPKFCEITGYSVAEALGKNPHFLTSTYHTTEFFEQLWQTLISGGSWFGEYLNRTKTGVDYWERATISPIRDAKGGTTHYVAVKEDITKEKQVLAELQKAKEMAESTSHAKSAFLAHMSHEIRTPMNAILGFSQLMLRDPELTAGQRQNLKIVNRSGEHLLGLINNILEMSKIESGHARLNLITFDFFAFLEDLETMFRVRMDTKQLRFSVVRDEKVPRYIFADESKLRQVLINLLGNSLKFTEHGGITLRVSCKRPGESGVSLVFEIEDTGVGISPAEMGKLFKRFEQTQSGRNAGAGTGLGLAISQEFVHLMGGKITVASEVGKKTSFWVEIPVKEEKDAAVFRLADSRKVCRLAPGQPAVRVLIADDLEENRTLLSGMLNAVGFETRRATDGLQALYLFELWQPQLILMDLRMPVMDGVESIRRIRATPHPVKIIVITASAFENDRKESLDAGADEFLAKPFLEDELFQKIQLQLNVVFEYESKQAHGPGFHAFDKTLHAEAFAKLPQPLVLRIREAALNADLDTLLELADKIATYDPVLGAELRTMAERFEYQSLLG